MASGGVDVNVGEVCCAVCLGQLPLQSSLVLLVGYRKKETVRPHYQQKECGCLPD